MQSLTLTTLDGGDAGLLTFRERAKVEEQQVGLAGFRQIERAAVSLYREAKDSGVEDGGLIREFERAATKLLDAQKREKCERVKAANSVFAELWTVAEPLFAEGRQAIEACPLCGTAIANTKAGSEEGIREHIAKHLEELRDYAAAKKQLDEAETGVSKARTHLLAGLQAILPLLTETDANTGSAVTSYTGAVQDCGVDALPDSAVLAASLRELATTLAARVAKIKSEQGEKTYGKACARIDRLIALRSERLLAEETNTQLAAISASLTDQANFVSHAIRDKVEALLNSLRAPTNEIYRKIQGAEAVPIRIELPPEEDVNQQRLNLLVDFAPNREGVQPAGYLSDSEIHSLALAMRLAAIKRFNIGAPIVALDDIVTSYDADHRRSIAAMIATELAEFQILLVTHDERFFAYLKDQLADKDWQFLRIIRLDRDFGPRFAEHKVSDAMIEARWNEGESAANQMRQAEEEWLLGICREFGCNVRIRTVENAHAYDRSELASALASFLKGAGLTPPLVPGVNNRFLASLQQGVVENFGSHFRDAPYAYGSIGDERARWEEFKFFRDQFSCAKCGRRRFKRPIELTKPVCAHESCQTPFAFREAGS